MKLTRGYNTLACLTVFLGILCYALADDKGSLALLAAPIVLAGWWTARRGVFPWVLPRWVINVLVIIAVLNSAVQVIVLERHEALVSDLSDFLVFIQLIKLFDRRRSRDDAQLLALSLFIVIGAILTDNSLAVGLCLLVYTPLATWTVMRHQIHAGAQDMAEARLAAGIPADAHVAAGAGHERHFRRLTAGAVAFSLAASIVIFVLLPRGFGGDAFGGFGRPTPGGITGFTDVVELGLGAGIISESQRPVMDVQLYENGRLAGGDTLTLYLRGTVLDRYDPGSGSWSRVRDSIETSSADHAGHVPLPLSAPSGATSQLRIRMRSAVSGSGYLFTVWRPVSVTADQTLNIIRPGAGGDLVVRYRRARSRNLNTVVEFTRDPGTMGAAGESPPPPRSPEGDFSTSPIHDLALRLLADRGLPVPPTGRETFQNREAVNAFQNYLRQRCTYTLEQELSPFGRDPIEWFIFDRRRGHCEYFASALVAMCWSVGIDARLVTGYVATEFDESNHSYLVRESNAHAWVEAELSPGRWITFDPTPPADLDRIHRAHPGLVGQLRRFYERLEFGWATSIVAFDSSRRASVYDATLGRSSLVESVRLWIDRISARVHGALSFLPVPTGLVQSFVYLAIVITLVAGTWLLLRSLLRRILARLRRRDDPALDPDLLVLLRQAGFYSEALDLLSRAGAPKPGSTPPLTHAAALDPALAADFADLSRLFYRVRFGRRPLSTEDATHAQALLARLRGAVGER